MRKQIVMNSVEQTHKRLNELADNFVQTWFYNCDPMDETRKEYRDQLKVILNEAYTLGTAQVHHMEEISWRERELIAQKERK